MKGPNIRDGAAALELCISALPSGCRFNILGFGVNYRTVKARQSAQTNTARGVTLNAFGPRSSSQRSCP
jgi:hypothetical protein